MSILVSTVLRRRWQPSYLLSRRGLLLVALLASLLLVADTAILVRAFRGNPYPYWLHNVDFALYYRASEAALAGNDPYAFEPCPCNELYGSTAIHDQYVYPPFFAFLMSPLTLVGPVAARSIWLVISLICLGVSALLLLRGFGTRVALPWIVVCCALVPLSRVGRVDIYHGQVNFILLFLVAWGLWFQTRKHSIVAGMLLGIAFVIKPFLGILVLYFLWRREWRTALASVLASSILCVLSFVPLVLNRGPAAIASWLATSAYYASGDAASRPDNQSLNGLLVRLFHANPFTVPWLDAPILLVVLRITLALVLLSIFFIAIGRRPQSAPAMLLAETGLLLGLALAYGPMFERSHLFILVPGLVGVLLVAYERRQQHAPNAGRWRSVALCWLLVFAFTGSPVEFSPGQPSPDAWTRLQGLPIVWTSLMAALVLGICAALAAALRRERIH